MVGSIASFSNANSAAVNQFFKAADNNQDGKITASELSQAMDAGNLQVSDSSGQKMTAAQVFKMLDSNNKGYVTKQDVASSLSQAKSKGQGSGQGPAKAGGDHDGDGGGSTTAKYYDPADTNQDGKVSSAEEAAYLAKLYTQNAAAQQASASTRVSTYA